MLEYTLNLALRPVLVASNSKRFSVARSDNLFCHIGPKKNLNFLKGSFILWRQFSGSGGWSGVIFWGYFPLGIKYS